MTTPIYFYKTDSLSNLKPNSLVALKLTGGLDFSLFVTDKIGIPYPLKDDTGGGTIAAIQNTDGNLTITGTTTKTINVSSSLLLLINSALQSGDNISELVNDANYITLADIPAFVASEYDLEDFTNASTDPFVRNSEITNGVTNLTYTPSPTNGTVTSDTGSDATIPIVDSTNAGLVSSSMKSIWDAKVNNGSVFVAGRLPYTSDATTLVDSSRLLWNNTNSYLEVNGTSPRFTLKNNLNSYSSYLTTSAGGTLFLKNHQDKTLAFFTNPVGSTEQPQMAIGQVSSIPVESQLYVYGGQNGANIDARGSTTVDEANIDLEGNDWETNVNSIGLSYFGSNATAFGTVMGYAKNKLGQIRFQDNTVSAITSNKISGVSPIRFGINDVEIGNVNDKGFSYQSDFSSDNSSNLRWLTDKEYVDASAFSELDKQLLYNNSSTGATKFTGFSINTDPTKYDIGLVEGWFVDNTTNPNAPTRVFKTFPATTGNILTNIATQNVTYIAIDINGVHIQSGVPFEPQLQRDYIPLGVVVHSNRTSINAVNNQPVIAISPNGQLSDLMESIGFFNITGNVFSPNGINLNINKSAGQIFKQGSNFINDNKDPHTLSLAALIAPSNIRYRTQLGAESANTNVIAPNFWDNAGTITAMTGTRWSIQRIYVFQSNLIRIQYGQATYATQGDAIQAIATEPFIVEQNILENGLFRGLLIVRRNATDLTDTTRALFIEASKFGSVAGLGSLSTTNLQQAYNNSVTPEVTTDSILGALTVKRGSAADTDTVFETQNGAGISTFSVTGSGNITALSYNGYTPENIANKQNSLAVDGTGTKYPTVDAVNVLKWIKSNESLSLAQRKGDILYGILDQYTGEEMTLSKITITPVVDGIIYFQLGSEYFKRNAETYNIKWFGAKGDGILDDSPFIRLAISKLPINGGKLLFPTGTYIHGDGTNPDYPFPYSGSVDIGTDISYTFLNYTNFEITGYGAKIKSNINNSNIKNNRIFDFKQCLNGVIKGLEVDGSISDRIPNGGDPSGYNEQSNFRFNTCKNIKVIDIISNNSVMDGFMVDSGRLFEGFDEWSEDIIFERCKANYNYRQGISVVNARRTKVYNSEFSYTGTIYGTSPMAGIDFEEGFNSAFGRGQKNSLVSGCKFINNTGTGVSFHYGTSESILEKSYFENCDFYIAPDADALTVNNSIKDNVFFNSTIELEGGGEHFFNNIVKGDGTKSFIFTVKDSLFHTDNLKSKKAIIENNYFELIANPPILSSQYGTVYLFANGASYINNTHLNIKTNGFIFWNYTGINQTINSNTWKSSGGETIGAIGSIALNSIDVFLNNKIDEIYPIDGSYYKNYSEINNKSIDKNVLTKTFITTSIPANKAIDIILPAQSTTKNYTVKITTNGNLTSSDATGSREDLFASMSTTRTLENVKGLVFTGYEVSDILTKSGVKVVTIRTKSIAQTISIKVELFYYSDFVNSDDVSLSAVYDIALLSGQVFRNIYAGGLSGTTSNRPLTLGYTEVKTGATYFDTTLGYEIVWNGTTWINPLNGSGTVNNLSKFTSNGTLENSGILDNGSVVNIGNSSVGKRLIIDKGSQNTSSSLATGALTLAYGAGTAMVLDMGVSIFGQAYIQARHGSASTWYDLHLNRAGGNVFVGAVTTDGVNKLQVEGGARFGSATLTTTPTISAGTYDILTRNTSTGVVEKVLSNTIATTAQLNAVSSIVYGSDVDLSSGQSPYTLLLTDANARLHTSLSFGQNYSIVVPTNAVVPFQIGTKVSINVTGASPGFLTLSGSGITFTGASNLKIRYRTSFIITKIATDTWFVEETNLWVTNASGSLVTNSDQTISGAFQGTLEGNYFGVFNQMSIGIGGIIDFRYTMGNMVALGGTVMNMTQNFSPTSITSPFTGFNLSPVINQTGGANGITRALYINPTLTSAVDFRAIEVTGGNSIFQKVIAQNTIRLKNYTVATLPTGTQGDTAYVTDALAPAYLTVIMGGGAVVCPVFYNGTNWVAH